MVGVHGVAGVAPKPAAEHETDAHRLQQRQKQIDFGKNTLGYVKYIETVPRYDLSALSRTCASSAEACTQLLSWVSSCMEGGRHMQFE